MQGGFPGRCSIGSISWWMCRGSRPTCSGVMVTVNRPRQLSLNARTVKPDQRAVEMRIGSMQEPKHLTRSSVRSG
jgi:hypothetical protein